MTDIEILNELQNNGVLKRLFRAGFVSSKVMMYREAYLEYDKQVRTTKRKNADIITEVADMFHISENKMYRIVQKLKPDGQDRCNNTVQG